MSVKSRVPYLYPVSQTGSYIIKISVRDGPVENLWGRGEVSQLTLTKYSCYGLKKIHTSNLITKKIPAARKFPSPPPRSITFLMVRPLAPFFRLIKGLYILSVNCHSSTRLARLLKPCFSSCSLHLFAR